jgi:hypothetical protein
MPTWAELFERAADHETRREAISDALGARRDGSTEGADE